MEASTLRESLVYMAENCPNRIGLNDSRDGNSILMIGLNDSRDRNSILMSDCNNKCIDCWIKALNLREGLLER